MMEKEKEDTEFRDYSSAGEDLFFIRRGRLRILISVEKTRQDISIGEKQTDPGLPDKDARALISRLEIPKREE